MGIGIKSETEGGKRAKRALRERLRAKRLERSAEERAACSRDVTARLSALLVGARSVALFWPMLKHGELDISPLCGELLGRGLPVYFPFMSDTGENGFGRVHSEAELVVTTRGFRQPLPAPSPEALDWILVPALAASQAGYRLGYGAGFYDRVLPRFAPSAQRAIVLFDEEIMPVPVEPHDARCEWLVTELRTQPVELVE